MTDGFGTVGYVYDSLSQMTSETRNFNETVPLTPLSNNGFQIQYTYGLSGQLKTLTEPFGEIITYGYNKTGQTTSVNGNRTVESLNMDYFTDAKYRAWGALKELDRGNVSVETLTYNNRLQPYQFTNAVISQRTYDYFNDGSLKTSQTGAFGTWAGILDRSYEYDFVGRMVKAKTGAEAHGQTETNLSRQPYRITLEYNAFGDILHQERLHYTSTFNSTFQYTNDRTTTQTDTETIPNWVNSSNGMTNVFDADGRKTGIQYGTSDTLKYDADGRMVHKDPIFDFDHDQGLQYDGNGQVIKMIKDALPIYHINSSVLGKEISRVWSNAYDGGVQRRTKIYANGTEIAERRMIFIGISAIEVDATFLLLPDPSGAEASEALIYYNQYGLGLDFIKGDATLDPFGAAVGAANPYPDGSPPGYNDCDYGYDGEPTDPCDIEGFDDPDNEAGNNGSVPKQTLIINGFKVNHHDAMMNPEAYEEDHGNVGIATYSDGHRGFVLRNQGDGNYSFPAKNASGRGPKPKLTVNNKRKKEDRQARKARGDAIAATGYYDNEGDGASQSGNPQQQTPHGPSAPIDPPPPPPKSKELQRAIDLAREMLKNKDCNDAVSSAIQNARGAAATLDDNRGASATVDEQREDDGGGYVAWTGVDLTITFYKGFYDGADGDVLDDSGKNIIKKSKLVEDPALRRAWTVLHELSHVTGRYIGHTGPTATSVAAVNRAIYDACLKKKVQGK